MAVIVEDHTLQFEPLRASRVVPGGMENVLVDAAFMRAADTVFIAVVVVLVAPVGVLPEPEPEPAVGTVGGVIPDILMG
jgi:hypothetical protein